jgi:hypothetical protein
MAKRRREADLLAVQFLVPVHDRNGEPYSWRVHERLRRDLEDRYGGWSSLGDKPLPGAWRNPQSGEVEYDDSWRDEVGIPERLLNTLDGYLAVLAHRLGQKAIWRVVYAEGQGKAIAARAPRQKGKGQYGA